MLLSMLCVWVCVSVYATEAEREGVSGRVGLCLCMCVFDVLIDK